MADARGYTAGRFAFELGKTTAGWIQSVEGGHATSDIITEKLGVDVYQHKHIGGVKYEDITLNCGTGMSKGFYEWIKQSFDLKHTRNDGAIHACDYDGNIKETLNFHNGLISEIGFPALDAASKDAAKMTIKIAPEFTRRIKGNGKVGVDKYSVGKGEQKKWVPSNFRLTIQGLEEACKRVNKIEAITLKQKIIENPIGEMRDYEKEPANLEVPNLVITMVESHADKFYQWHKTFVIDGANGQDQEKGATLEYLTPDLKTVLFTLTFHNLGIFKLTPEKVEAGSENIRRIKAEMYCEKIDFAYGGGSVFA
jgi:phage tail-like protein